MRTTTRQYEYGTPAERASHEIPLQAQSETLDGLCMQEEEKLEPSQKLSAPELKNVGNSPQPEGQAAAAQPQRSQQAAEVLSPVAEQPARLNESVKGAVHGSAGAPATEEAAGQPDASETPAGSCTLLDSVPLGLSALYCTCNVSAAAPAMSAAEAL